MTKVVAGLLCLALLAAWGCSASQQERAKSDVDDALIFTQVRAKISAIDPATVSLVNVDVHRRAVTLTGQVHSADERSKVDAAARSVSGVTSVDDRLRINPKAPTASEVAADMALQAKVKTALAAQTGVNAFKVQVSVHAGVAALEGTVPSETVHTLVLQTARGVAGVRRVVDHLRIEKS
jgi:osmotically-inducible protein OsmY